MLTAASATPEGVTVWSIENGRQAVAVLGSQILEPVPQGRLESRLRAAAGRLLRQRAEKLGRLKAVIQAYRTRR